MNRDIVWTVIYIALCGGLAWLLFTNWEFIRDSYRELRYKVTWPGMKEVQGTTIVVIIATAAFTLYLFLCDVVLQKTIISLIRYFHA